MPQLDDLKLDEAHTEAIVELGIKYGAYSEEMPESKKEKLAAAHEILAFTIDAWVNDEVRTDDDDPEVAESGRQIVEIHELAGITVSDEGDITIGEPAALEYDDEDEDTDTDAVAGDDEAEDEDEVPFDPDDYITGYTEMSVAAKARAIKALDADDDDDVATMEALVEWENEQDKPASRVLSLIEETLGYEDEDEADAEADAEAETEEDEAEEEDAEDIDDDEPEAEADEEDESEEPWEGYDALSATDIKQILNDQLVDEDAPLTAEQVEYVLEYERKREKPPPRKRVIALCEEMLASFESGDEEPEAEAEPEEAEEEAPAPRKRGRRVSKSENGELSDADLRELVPAGLERAFVNAKLHDKSLAIAGLGEPSNWEGDMPEIPADIATINHEEMSNLLAGFANAMSTSLWQASKHYIEADILDEIAEYFEDIAMLDTSESNEGKRKAAARTDERVVAARGAQKEAYHNYVRFRDLARTIELKWRTVSRVGGFVSDEAESESAGAMKRSTRGTAAGAAKGASRGSAKARSSR